MGAGKTTVLKALASIGYGVRLEPVNSWEPFLKRYYESASNAFALQTRIMYDMTAPLDGDVQLTERCAWTQPFTFIRVMHKRGDLTDEESDLLIKLNERLCVKPAGIIYLRCDPEEAMKRIQRRGRGCEATVQSDYLRSLDAQYEECIKQAISNGINVRFLDVTHMKITEVVEKVLWFFNNRPGEA